MSDEAGFIAAILDDPKEDTHRLVYADWLDEHGRHERAEFIRVQCELATFDPNYYLCFSNRKMCESSAVPLIRRSAELLHPAWSQWFLDTRPASNITGVNDWEFRRGFVSSLSCTWPDWLAHHAAILAAQPIERVKLTTRPDWESWDMTHFEHLRLLKQNWPKIEFELPRWPIFDPIDEEVAAT